MDTTPQPVINYASPGTVRPPRKFAGLFGWVLFIGLAIMLFLVLQSNKSMSTDVSLSEFQTQFQNGNVSQVVVDGDMLRGTLIKPGTIAPGGAAFSKFRTELPATMSQNWSFIQWLLDHRQSAEVRVENNGNLVSSLLLPLIPWLLIFAFVWFFIMRSLRKAQPGKPKPTPVYIVTPENQ